jgi:hypothetical protein
VLLEVNAILASPSRTNKMMSIDVLFVTHSDWDPLILQSCQLGSSDPAVMSPPIDLSLRGIRRCLCNRRHSWILLSPASTFLNIVNIQGSLRSPRKICRQDMHHACGTSCAPFCFLPHHRGQNPSALSTLYAATETEVHKDGPVSRRLGDCLHTRLGHDVGLLSSLVP